MRIAHLSDIHIRKNPSRNEEYKQVFDTTFSTLKNLNIDCIVVTGDLVHDKLTMFPEQFGLLLYFLSNLEKIAPVVLIRGNHDYNEKNPNREDILEQLMKYNTLTNTTFLLNSGFYQDKHNSNIIWTVWNHKDKMNPWRDIKNPFIRNEKIFVDLYHDPIIGCKLPFNVSSEGKIHSSVSYKDFLGDIAMLGDIHKYQTFNEGKIAYAGSLIQQDYGEEPYEHGFIIWDIDTLSHSFIKIKNDYSFHKVFVNEDLDLNKQNYDFSSNPRISLLWKDYNFKVEKEKEILNYFKKYNPIELKLEKRPLLHKNEVDISESILSDISKKDVQISIIEQYLKERQYSEETIQQVLALDALVDSKVDTIERSTKDIFLQRLIIENFMSYEQLDLNWSDVQGIISINAPNKSGKTTLFSAICWLLFGKTLYTGKEKENVFNKVNKADKVSVSGILTINGAEYGIERSISRKLGKKGYTYSTINLDFFVFENGNKKYLTDEVRAKTQKEIDSWIGSYDDFIRNNIVTADVLNNYIAATPSTLIDSLLKDLGMGYYETKLDEFKKILKEHVNKEGILKINLNECIATKENLSLELNEIKLKKEENLLKKNKLTERIDKGLNMILSVKEQMYKIEDQYLAINEENELNKFTNLKRLVNELEDSFNQLEIEKQNIEKEFNLDLLNSLKEEKNEISKTLKKYYDRLQVLTNDLHNKEQSKNIAENTISSLESKKELIKSKSENEKIIYNNKLDSYNKEIEKNKTKITDLESKLLNLSTSNTCVRCGYEIISITEEEYTKEKQILNEEIDSIKKEVQNISLSMNEYKENEKTAILNRYNQKIEELNEISSNESNTITKLKEEINNLKESIRKGKEYINEQEEKENSLNIKIVEQENIVKKLNLIDKNKIDIITKKEKSQSELNKLDELIKNYTRVKEQVLKNKELSLKVEEYTKVIDELKVEKNEIENLISFYNKDYIIKEKNISDINEQIEKFEKQEKEREIWTLYQSVLHRDGVPTFILKMSINLLNAELNRILEGTGVVFYFDEDLNMIMENEFSGEKQKALQGSGAERTFMAIALKIVSRIVNNNVRYNFILLDECLDKLDDMNIDVFKNFIRETKTIIPIIPIISHTESLSEIADYHFDIEKINGISKLTVR